MKSIIFLHTKLFDNSFAVVVSAIQAISDITTDTADHIPEFRVFISDRNFTVTADGVTNNDYEKLKQLRNNILQIIEDFYVHHR